MSETKSHSKEVNWDKLKSILKDLEAERFSAINEHRVRVMYNKALKESLEARLEKYLEKELSGQSTDEEYQKSVNTYLQKIYSSTQIDFESSFHDINDSMYNALINIVSKSIKKKTIDPT